MVKNRRYYVRIGKDEIYFTQREKDIVDLLLDNPTYKQMAQELDISPRTVEFYLESIKLKCRERKKKLLINLLQTLDF